MQYKVVYKNIDVTPEQKKQTTDALNELIKRHNKTDCGKLKITLSETWNQRDHRVDAVLTCKSFKAVVSKGSLEEVLAGTAKKVDDFAAEEAAALAD